MTKEEFYSGQKFRHRNSEHEIFQYKNFSGSSIVLCFEMSPLPDSEGRYFCSLTKFYDKRVSGDNYILGVRHQYVFKFNELECIPVAADGEQATK